MSELSFRPARVPTNDSKNSVTSSTNSVTSTSKRPSAAAPSSSGDDGMITVRAHNKKTGEITVMRVKRGTPMREVMASYAFELCVGIKFTARSSSTPSPRRLLAGELSTLWLISTQVEQGRQGRAPLVEAAVFRGINELADVARRVGGGGREAARRGRRRRVRPAGVRLHGLLLGSLSEIMCNND